MKKIIIIVSLFFSFTLFLSAQDFSLNVFPEKKVWEKFFADAISHQLSLSKHLESSEWYGNIGAEIPLLNFCLDSKVIQFSLGATDFNTLIKTPGHVQVFTVDYRVDFFTDMKIWKNLYGRWVLGHLSAHFSDDGITQLNYFPVSYVRDYTGLLAEYIVPFINGKVYGGGFYNYHNEPVLNKHSTFQFGGDAAYHIYKGIGIYAAFDIKIKSEINNGTTRSFQAGIIYPEKGRKTLRIAFTHREGFEDRGQLFWKKSVKNTLGIYFDF